MKIKLPKSVKKVINVFEQAGYEIYIVGGAVRDILSGKEATDWDFTTNAKPEEIQKLFPNSFYDNNFGTVGIAEKYLGGKGEEILEITTFRTESGYSDCRRPDKVEWGANLKEDLGRRDFTINALALNKNLKIIDYFNGQKDLKNKLIRAVGDPNKRFKEDALRMMRAIRIASQLGFIIETKTLTAINKNSNLINQISKERIRDELLKIIASKFPKDGVLLLFNAGLLKYILPELLETRGVKQAGHHTKDVWNHSLDSLAACPSSEPIVKLATLLHDIGKPKVKASREGKEITFYNHEVVGAKMTKAISKRLRLAKKDSDLLWLLVRWHMFAYETKMTDKAIRRFIRRVGKENINRIMDLRVGDRIGGGSKETSWRLKELQKRIVAVQQTPMQVTDLKVNGKDVMRILKIQPGPKVGIMLKKLFDEVMEDSTKNNREYLLKRIKKISC